MNRGLRHFLVRCELVPRHSAPPGGVHNLALVEQLRAAARWSLSETCRKAAEGGKAVVLRGLTVLVVL